MSALNARATIMAKQKINQARRYQCSLN
jgi:hypothetical protein